MDQPIVTGAVTAAVPTPFQIGGNILSRYIWILKPLFFIALIVGIVAILLSYRNTLVKGDQTKLSELRLKQKGRVDSLNAEFVNTQGQRAKPATSLYNGLLAKVNARQKFLVNLCPLTVRLPGYLGPPEDGIFDEEEGVRIAVAAGARAFFIPLTYFIDGSKKPPMFPESQSPTIVARSNSGVFLSQNAGFLKATIDAIVKHRNASPVTANEPILIFLHGDETIPSSSLAEKTYIDYISAVAEACKGVLPHAPKQIGQIGYTQKGRGNKTIMLDTPLSLLAGKIILFTNLSLSPEENPAYANKTKLSDMVNIYYTNNASDSSPGAKVVGFGSLQGAGETYKESTRINFTVALPQNEQVVGPQELEGAFSQGIQCVPLDFISNMEAYKEVWQSWKGAGWRMKPEQLRYTQPEVIVPQKPSAILNARVEGAQYAGQVVIR